MTRQAIHSLAMVALLSSAALIGCTSSRSAVGEVGVPATQPSDATVRASNFDDLWAAADAVARDLLFVPDRQDRRSGTLTTEPMTSAQWFEPWRQELRTPEAVAQSSLATVRRTLTIQITRDESGTFVAKPTVLVERFSQAERRITSSARYRQVYRNSRNRGYGTAETDAGIVLPDTYWYAIGNDPALERYVAQKIENRLAS